MVQQEMEATDSIVFRPTSRRREINRAVCIHRRIFQRLSLQDGDDDEERCDYSCMIDAPPVRISTGDGARRDYVLFVKLLRLPHCLYLSPSRLEITDMPLYAAYRREHRDFNESLVQNNTAFHALH